MLEREKTIKEIMIENGEEHTEAYSGCDIVDMIIIGTRYEEQNGEEMSNITGEKEDKSIRPREIGRNILEGLRLAS
jgi:hypothetical protein